MTGKAAGTWKTRDCTLHSLHDASEADARSFVDGVTGLIGRLAEPLEQQVRRIWSCGGTPKPQ